MRPLRSFNENDLIRCLRQGDEKAFDELYYRYLPNLLGFARSYLLDTQEAEEAVQDIFVKIWEKRESMDENKNFRAYLFQAVRNHLLNIIRNQKKICTLENMPIDKEVCDDNVLIDLSYKDFTSKIYFLIKTLPHIQQQIFIMSRMEGLTNAEIAVKLDLPKRTIEYHIYTATKFLKRELIQTAPIYLPFFILFYY